MHLRILRRQIVLFRAFLAKAQDRESLRSKALELFVSVPGAKLGRKAVYAALSEACGRVVSNGFVSEVDAVLTELGARKGNSHGYRNWRGLAFRSSGTDASQENV